MPIKEGGFIPATAFKAVKAGGDDAGLKLFDPGYMNTAGFFFLFFFFFSHVIYV